MCVAKICLRLRKNPHLTQAVTPAEEDGSWPWVNGALIPAPPGSGIGFTQKRPRSPDNCCELLYRRDSIYLGVSVVDGEPQSRVAQLARGRRVAGEAA